MKRRLQQETLRHRVALCCKSSHSTVDEIVNHLQSTHSEYRRIKHKFFARLVEEALPSPKNHHRDVDDDDEGESGSAKKRRKKESDDDVVEKGNERSPSTTSFDEEKSEQSFDLMKEVLRDSYMVTTKEESVKKKKKKPLAKEKEKDVESASTGHLNCKSSSSNNGGGGIRFIDFGGISKVLKQVKEEVIDPIKNFKYRRYLGAGRNACAGILLHGPPGCGKTDLALAIANETGLPFYQTPATNLVSGVSGATEENIRELFSKAYRTSPSIIFIDHIDAIASRRENSRPQMENRIVTELVTCMNRPPDSDEYVLVIGATNNPDAIDPALRRNGHFDREIAIGIPDESAREEILAALTRNLILEGSIDLREIAKSTAGFVRADLMALSEWAAERSVRRWRQEHDEEILDTQEILDKLVVRMSDFEEAVKIVKSSTREGFSNIPDVKWEDVGGLDFLRKEFERHIVRPIKNPRIYERYGLDTGMGILLHGPPGCGKTLIAKAVANEAGAKYIYIKGPELLNKFVGESELAVRTLFSRARTCSPCIIFFDEVDSLTTKRGEDGGQVVERLVNQLLIELDGAEQQKRGVFVIGATNRPEVMDPALLRSGRFGVHLYVPLPSADQRVSILKALARKKPIDASVDLSAIARMQDCENMSGADLAAVMNEAATLALEEEELTMSSETSSIKTSHFEVALRKVSNMMGQSGLTLQGSNWQRGAERPLQHPLRVCQSTH